MDSTLSVWLREIPLIDEISDESRLLNEFSEILYREVYNGELNELL